MSTKDRYFHYMRRMSCICLFGLALLSSFCRSEDRKPGRDSLNYVGRGMWSGEAISLFNVFGGFGVGNLHRDISFYSPDHKKLVHVHKGMVSISIEGKEYATDFGMKSSAELGWSPDSSRFFLTWTDGGELGEWHVEVYDVSSKQLQQIEADRRPKQDFAHFISTLPRDDKELFWETDEYCDPNLVAAQWLNGSSELLVSALVPNIGDCRYMSEFSVYRLAIPSGEILQRYTAKEAHANLTGKIFL